MIKARYFPKNTFISIIEFNPLHIHLFHPLHFTDQPTIQRAYSTCPWCTVGYVLFFLLLLPFLLLPLLFPLPSSSSSSFPPPHTQGTGDAVATTQSTCHHEAYFSVSGLISYGCIWIIGKIYFFQRSHEKRKHTEFRIRKPKGSLTPIIVLSHTTYLDALQGKMLVSKENVSKEEDITSWSSTTL